MIAPFGLSRRIIVVTLSSAVVAAGIAWLSVQAKNTPEPSPQGTSIVATETYLFSSNAISVGERISVDLFASVEMRPDQAGANLLLDSAKHRTALADLSAHRSIPMGTPFLASDLEIIEPDVSALIAEETPASKMRSAASLVRPGMQAIAVAIANETALARLISSGDRIDVLVSYVQEGGIRAVRTVLQSVRVIETDISNTLSETSVAAKTVTLEVTPEGAKMLTLARHSGDLVLVVSNHSDDDMPSSITNDAPILSTRIVGKTMTADHSPGTADVRIIRGSTSDRPRSSIEKPPEGDPPMALN